MKKHTKVLLTLLCAVLLVVGSVMGTLAYLTDKDNVTNTFTVGKVGLDLNEAKVDEYGNPVVDEDGNPTGERTETGNEYKLLPGHTYTKDPTVTVDADSEESYIRMIVTITDFADVKEVLGDDFLPQYFVGGWLPDVWKTTNTVVVSEDGNSATYEFRYYKTVNTIDSENTLKLEPLFTSFTMPDGIANEELLELEEMEIQVVAQAIQADGFGTADDAWAAFEVQHPAA